MPALIEYVGPHGSDPSQVILLAGERYLYVSRDLWYLYEQLRYAEGGQSSPVEHGPQGPISASARAALSRLAQIADKGTPPKRIKLRIEFDLRKPIAALAKLIGTKWTGLPWSGILGFCFLANMAFFVWSRFFGDTIILSVEDLIAKFTILILLGIGHELSHSVTATALGAPSGKIGMGVRGFIPVLYADVNNIWRLPPNQRAFVNGAGIVWQALAGVALIVAWYRSDYPVLRALAEINFIVMSINALPVSRLDGYWFVADRFDKHNLHNDVLRYMFQLFKRRDTKISDINRWYIGYFFLFVAAVGFLTSLCIFLAIDVWVDFRAIQSNPTSYNLGSNLFRDILFILVLFYLARIMISLVGKRRLSSEAADRDR